MNSEQTQAIMAACRALWEEDNCLYLKNPWKRHATLTLHLIQDKLRDNNIAQLCVLAEIWTLATKQPKLGETFPSYAFLQALLVRPELGFINWDQGKNPLPVYDD